MELPLDKYYAVSSTATSIESNILSNIAKMGAAGVLALIPLQNANCTTLSTAAAIVRTHDSRVSSTSIVYREFDRIEFQVAASDLLSSSANLLGSNSYERFKRFLEYSDGWGGGFGKKLSTQSVAALQNFLSDGQSLCAEPSIFLRQDGNLQLAWEDAEGNAVELDFLPSGITFFHEKSDKESIYQLDTQSISSLKENIRALLQS